MLNDSTIPTCFVKNFHTPEKLTKKVPFLVRQEGAKESGQNQKEEVCAPLRYLFFERGGLS